MQESQTLQNPVLERKEMAEMFCGMEDEVDVDMCKSQRTEIMYFGTNLETVKASEQNTEINRFGIKHFIKKGINMSIPKLAEITIMTKNPFEFFQLSNESFCR